MADQQKRARKTSGEIVAANGGSEPAEGVPHPNGKTANGQAKDGATKETSANGRSRKAADTKQPKVRYDCLKCPGYCCSYPVIVVNKYDLVRLGRHLGMTPEQAEKHCTKSAHGYKRVLRQKADPLYGRVCRFFDQENRRCGIYEARPHICRSFPGTPHCGYYDFLSFERRTQNDPDFISTTDHR